MTTDDCFYFDTIFISHILAVWLISENNSFISTLAEEKITQFTLYENARFSSFPISSWV